MKKATSSLKKGRQMYIFEAALEYLVSILVTGSFLATLTKEIGFSDSLTGILSSVISLGCLFQLVSILMRPKRIKSIVIVFSIINQLLFGSLYVIPLINLSAPVKTVLFILIIVSAYFVYYLAHPKKTNWLMSMVDDAHRGSFTANKEIVSLVAGMVFFYAMGYITDLFADAGKIETAFYISATVILALTAFHTVTMILTPKAETNIKENVNPIICIKETFSNKSILYVTGVSVIYYIAAGVCTPFYGTYFISELGFNLKFVTLLSVISSIARVIASVFSGRYADKKSFAAMIEICFVIISAAFLCGAFAVPSNGKLMFVLYHILHGIAMGGINSALSNMVFDYVPHEKRADSLAVCQAASGLAGFLTTLCASGLVSHIQQNANCFFGVSVYAQQVTSFMGVFIMIVAIVYVRSVVMRKCKK